MARRTTGRIPAGTEYHEEPLNSKNQTGRKMYAIVEEFHSDLDTAFLPRARNPLSSLPIQRFFDFVKDIPYRRDNKPVEVIARPAHILRFAALGMDCKKKAILIASWLRANGIPYRLIASSKRPDKRVHHVFPQGKLDNRWTTLDATYSWFRPGEVKEVTHAEVLAR